MDKRSDAPTPDNWLECALARWEWEGGHVAFSEEGNAASGGKERIALSGESVGVIIALAAGNPGGN